MRSSNRFLSAALAATALLATGACAKKGAQAPAGGAPGTTQQPGAVAGGLAPSTVVATIDGQPITAQDLDEAAGDEINQAMQQVYEARKNGLNGLVAERLIDAEAKARGVDKETLLKTEIADKATPPTEAEMKEFYEKSVKPQAPGVSYEDAKSRIEQMLMREKQGRRAQAFFDELKQKHKVTMSLPLPETPRVQVEAVGPAMGPQNAKITIVEFSDFECPFCGRAKETVDQVMKNYEGKVRLVFRQFPLSFHPHAEKAAEAALCANEQGKFWQMHDVLFAHRDALEPAQLKGYAKEVGLDQAKFDACLDGGQMAAQVQKDMEAGKKARVNGTPAFFINGRALSGAQPYENFKEIIDSELAAK